MTRAQKKEDVPVPPAEKGDEQLVAPYEPSIERVLRGLHRIMRDADTPEGASGSSTGDDLIPGSASAGRLGGR